MDRRTFILLAVAAVIVIIVLAAFAFMKQTPAPSRNQASQEGGAAAAPTSTTRVPAPAGIAVPGESAANVPSNVAVPKMVSRVSPSSAASFRSFDITARGGTFTPDTIIVRLNDIVYIKMTAADKDYDFTQPDFGYKLAVPAGATRPIEFGAVAVGKFTFYCASCGGPATGPVGYIIVTPK